MVPPPKAPVPVTERALARVFHSQPLLEAASLWDCCTESLESEFQVTEKKKKKKYMTCGFVKSLDQPIKIGSKTVRT